MARETSRRSGVREIDEDNRVWCPSSARYVHVERCMGCGRLTGMHERGNAMYVLCREDSGDRHASVTGDRATMRRR